MRFVAISDTHGWHSRLEVPDGDVLLHSGDLCNRGALAEVESFDRFLAGLPHTHKIVIAGNHDFCFERQPKEAQARLTHCTYLQDEAVVIEGIKIYGSPWQPRFCDWAFNLARGPALAEKWAMIPEDTDILLTHGPPRGCLDRTHDGREVGCEDLRQRLEGLAVKHHIFGHIHEAYGHRLVGQTNHYNASVLNHFRREWHPAWVFDFERPALSRTD